MSRVGISLIFVAALFLALPACGGGSTDGTPGTPDPTPPDPDPPPPPPPAPVTYAEIQTIFTSRCTGCHSPAGIASFMDLSAGVSHGNIVGVTAQQTGIPRVTPGDETQSYLWHKLNGTHTDPGVGGNGQSMPPGGSLAASELSLIQRWIQEGATDM